MYNIIFMFSAEYRMEINDNLLLFLVFLIVLLAIDWTDHLSVLVPTIVSIMALGLSYANHRKRCLETPCEPCKADDFDGSPGETKQAEGGRNAPNSDAQVSDAHYAASDRLAFKDDPSVFGNSVSSRAAGVSAPEYMTANPDGQSVEDQLRKHEHPSEGFTYDNRRRSKYLSDETRSNIKMQRAMYEIGERSWARQQAADQERRMREEQIASGTYVGGDAFAADNFTAGNFAADNFTGQPGTNGFDGPSLCDALNRPGTVSFTAFSPDTAVRSETRSFPRTPSIPDSKYLGFGDADDCSGNTGDALIAGKMHHMGTMPKRAMDTRARFDKYRCMHLFHEELNDHANRRWWDNQDYDHQM